MRRDIGSAAERRAGEERARARARGHSRTCASSHFLVSLQPLSADGEVVDHWSKFKVAKGEADHVKVSRAAVSRAAAVVAKGGVLRNKNGGRG